MNACQQALEGRSREERETEANILRLAARHNFSEEVLEHELNLTQVRQRWIAERRELLSRRLTDLETRFVDPEAMNVLHQRLKDRLAGATCQDRRFVLEAVGATILAQGDGSWELELLVPRAVSSEAQEPQIVNTDTPVRFFNDDSKARGGITLTDDFFHLAEGSQFNNLPQEAEARWNLVETAWGLNMAANLLEIEYDLEGGQLYVPRRDTSRVDVTSCRDALNGYQKGKWFYCFRDISIEAGNERLAHVDHFLPHILKESREIRNLDGVWNLVLACQRCNREKLARAPQVKYLERLNTRNNYLISSHHPLREPLIRQTGTTARDRRSFFITAHKSAVDTLIHTWGPSEEFEAAF